MEPSSPTLVRPKFLRILKSSLQNAKTKQLIFEKKKNKKQKKKTTTDIGDIT